jgi:diguanylate cyclase (GGDEF)-like protein
MDKRDCLLSILQERSLVPVFQPIIAIHDGKVIGYEGLVRGPANSLLPMPQELFETAIRHDLLLALETLCLYQVLTEFLAQALTNRLFANISPYALLNGALDSPLLVDLLAANSPLAGRIVFELTEGTPQMPSADVVAGIRRLQDKGFYVALDDLGEGFSSLRLWAEASPQFVKIDKHFVSGIDKNPLNLQFVRAIKQIADKSNATLIAEGIETRAEFLLLKELGVCCGQGYFIGRPSAQPGLVASPAVMECIQLSYAGDVGWLKAVLRRGPQARLLLNKVPTVDVATSSEDAHEILLAHPDLEILPVLKDGMPVGVLNRTMVDKFSRQYIRELYARQPCTLFMDKGFIAVELDTPIVALSQLVLAQGRKRFADGFVLTHDGRYVGVGSNFALMQEMTTLQIKEARYANPLTLLPGNVPINEQIDVLLANGVGFCACYVDLDNFKPFNDVFGYAHGDELIKLTARVLTSVADQDVDFVGHIGGDDFFVLFQSNDWMQRCHQFMAEFDAAVQLYVAQAQLGEDGYRAEDRRGDEIEYVFPTVSIGALPVVPRQYLSCYEISAAAAEVKKAAKKISGSSLYVNQRVKVQEGMKVLAA